MNPYQESSLFEEDVARIVKARTMFHYLYPGVSQAVPVANMGIGSQYGNASLDAKIDCLDGSMA